MEPRGQKPLVVSGAVKGLFEEEEEEIGIASDVLVVKFQGEDSVTRKNQPSGQGGEVCRRFSIVEVCCLGLLVRKPPYRNNSLISV